MNSRLHGEGAALYIDLEAGVTHDKHYFTACLLELGVVYGGTRSGGVKESLQLQLGSKAAR